MRWRLALLLIMLALGVLLPRLKRKHDADLLCQCKSKQRNYGTAAEMYSTDYAGRYPTRPEQLVPGYLRELPRCPTNGSEYYFVSASNPDLYTIICRGYHP